MIIISELSIESHKICYLSRLCVSPSKSAVYTYKQSNFYHSATFFAKFEAAFYKDTRVHQSQQVDGKWLPLSTDKF